MTKPWPVLLVLLALLPAGCESVGDIFESDAIESEPLADDPDTLWDVTRVTIMRSEFDIDGDETDAGDRVLVTKWKESLMPFRFQGNRHRITAKVRPASEKDGMWALRILVESQRNENIQEPMNSGLAEWKDIAPDPLIAESLIHRVKTYLAR